jgi:6,7-dimethyl-8-ribityllumazine synthase
MSKKIPPRPPQLHTTTSPRFAIVASEYHPEFVQSLINHVCKELYALEENCIIELFGVPGSFEIPVLAEMIANQRRHDVIIALGLIMQGQTRHAEFIGLSVSQALQTVAIKHSIPVIHEVLMVSHEEEARVRCINKETNRGIEAARAAFSMLRVREQLKRNTTRKS